MGCPEAAALTIKMCNRIIDDMIPSKSLKQHILAAVLDGGLH
jgi:hypothetical protein